MTGWLSGLVGSWGLTGIRLDLAVSLIITVFLMIMAVLIGCGIERLDMFLMQGMSKATGRKAAAFILNRVMFIGTVFHELSHALFAVLTGAKVKKIRCFTLFSKEMLGYVEFIPRGGKIKQALQLALVSCAPVVTGFVTVPCFIVLGMNPVQPWWGTVLCYYCALSILCHMSMSKWDLKLYARGCIVALPVFTAIVFLFRFFFVKI